MKKALFLSIFVLFLWNGLYSQVVMTNNGNTSRCNFTFYDPGGPNNNHGHNQNMTHTICSNNGRRMLVEFSLFDLGVGDFLFVYNGSTVNPLNLISMYSAANVPTVILSTDDCLTFRFLSNATSQGAGWAAYVKCFECQEMSTLNGSPCSEETPMQGFCTGDDNPYGTTSYEATTGNSSGSSSAGATAFFGQSSAGCLYSFPNPAWYVMRVREDGDFVFDISQQDATGQGRDVDFACWGPFEATTQNDLMDLICCGHYQLSTSTSDMVDCSYSAAAVEECNIPNAREGEWYILLLTNYSGRPATISYELNQGSTGSMDCEITASFTATPTCDGEDLLISIVNPKPGDQYEFIGQGGFHHFGYETNITIPNVTLDMAGECKLIIYRDGLLLDSSFNNITINPLPILHIDTAGVLCRGMDFTITATDSAPGGSATTFWWSSSQYNSNDASYTFMLTDSITFHLHAVSSAGCESNSSIKITPDRPPTLRIDPLTLCSGMPVTVSSNDPANTFQWSTGETATTIKPVSDYVDNISVMVSTPNGCTNIGYVTVYPQPVADFEMPDPPYEIIDNAITLLFTDKSKNASFWEWNFGDYKSLDNTSTESSPSHTYTSHGWYTVTQTVRSENPRCNDVHSETFEIEQPFYFYIPNSFTPNNDGINDEFKIVGKDFSDEDYSIYIYERNGTLVFKSENPEISWNGKDLKGSDCPSGVYLCVVRVKMLTGKRKEFIQSLTIHR